ncbi:hypothetical protein FG386_000574 [Cryptosporidium ryanae]|uniref:uncharacterized protein n=1 Tax=Cryptosporidium ryanae TaxID=515981 RepID=UPI00351A02F1|nr:hypothetical protein FG386_000574 [Cryptosporidium ryanae]
MTEYTSNRYYHLFRNWMGVTKGFEDIGGSKVVGSGKTDAENDENSNFGNSDDQATIGVVSGIPPLNEFLKPLSELPNDLYLNILSRYKCLLHELKIRLAEIFKRNCDKYKLQYKLDIVDERMAIIKELGNDIYKLSPQDLSSIHTQKDKEECLMVDKLTPICEKVEELIDREEELFLMDLNEQLRSKLNSINNDIVQFQNQINDVEKELKDLDETSHTFMTDAIDVFKKWSKNSMNIIKAVEKAN